MKPILGNRNILRTKEFTEKKKKFALKCHKIPIFVIFKVQHTHTYIHPCIIFKCIGQFSEIPEMPNSPIAIFKFNIVTSNINNVLMPLKIIRVLYVVKNKKKSLCCITTHYES